MSSRIISAKSETLTYRQFFAVRWQRFVKANFESPAHAAMVFRVDPSTAENWFAGTNAPQGWVVGRAIDHPELGSAVIHYLKGTS